METAKLLDIMLVEDNENDVILTRRVLSEAKIANELNVIGDGETALDYVFRNKGYADAPRPDLILLDMFLPRMDGQDVLAALRARPETAQLPVVMLTGADIEQGGRRHNALPNGYIIKPLTFMALMGCLHLFDNFTLGLILRAQNALPLQQVAL